MIARLVQVIETDLHLRGGGTEASPYRRVMEYYSLDGTLLASAPDELEDRPVKILRQAIIDAVNVLDKTGTQAEIATKLEAALNRTPNAR